ncbi:MAG: hypothetical protein HAW59_04250 [Betaproteobacteria bacterium]|nr:hypothetical protein [Betaproteobacteria bacterium]
MNNEKLYRALDSVGKEVFVKYFAVFRQCAKSGNNAACLQKMQEVGNSAQAQQTRCSRAKAIFNAKKECKALKMCAAANRIPDAAKKRAQSLYQKHCG